MVRKGVVLGMALFCLFFVVSPTHAGSKVDFSYMRQNLYKFTHGKYGTAYVVPPEKLYNPPY